MKRTKKCVVCFGAQMEGHFASGHSRVGMESLERRQLLSAAVALEGTSGNDNFSVSYNPATMVYSFSGGITTPGLVSASGFAGFNLVGEGGDDTLTINGGTPTLLNNIGTDGSTFSVTVASGTLGLASAEDLASLTLTSTSAVQVLGIGHVLSTSALVFGGTTNAWQGSLDLAGNDLIAHSGDLPTLTNQLKSGFNNGAWNGSTGIKSSAATTDVTHLSSLGIASNDDGSGNAIYNAFSGKPAVASDILVKFTYFGDANLDGKVDGSDYSRIDSGFVTHATGWNNGDFNYDGAINGSDYTLIDNAFNTQGGTKQAVTLTSPTSAEIDLTFSDKSGSDVQGYNIYRSTTSGFTPSASTYVIFEPDPTFQDSGLTPGTQYYYVIQAVHSDQSTTTLASNVTSTTLASDSSVPLQPTDLVATNYNTSDVDLSWTDNSNNETGFLIEYAHDGEGDWTVAQIAPAHSTGDTVYELSQDTAYDFRVTAINSMQTTASAVTTPVASPATTNAITPAATTSPTTQATTQQISGKDVFVALIGGNWQTMAFLTGGNGQGVGAIGKLLAAHHDDYDVHIYASYKQESVNDNGTGKAEDEIVAAFASGIRNWALIGYSHGAGSAYNLDTRVHALCVVRQPVPLRLIYSAYIAGVQHNNATDMSAQTTPPVDSSGQWFSNWYEDNDDLGVHTALGGVVHDHLVHYQDGNVKLAHHTSIDKQPANLIMPLADEAVTVISANLGG